VQPERLHLGKSWRARWLGLLLLSAGLLFATACGGEEAAAPTPTMTILGQETDPGVRVPVPSQPEPRVKSVSSEPTATQGPRTNRSDCDEIRGTAYHSPEERA